MRDFREQGRGHRGRRFEGEPWGWEGRRRGGRMRRGDIRTALLAILAEEPGHGYDLIQRLEEKTEGAWRPSPGSVYPTLQLLEDEGLARTMAALDSALARGQRWSNLLDDVLSVPSRLCPTRTRRRPRRDDAGEETVAA